MADRLNKLTIRGFKSIAELVDFEPGDLTVLIGANGAGKSNFVEFFRLLRAMADESLPHFVSEAGGGDSLFFLGPKVTRTISARLEFGDNVYEFDLQPTADYAIMVADERTQYTGGHGWGRLGSIGKGNRQSRLKAMKDEPSTMTGKGHGVEWYVHVAVSSWTVYHFHDTSMLAPARREHSAHDNNRFRHDASNIAAFLLKLRGSARDTYALIRDTVRLIAPFFDDFVLDTENKGGTEMVRLAWRQKGSDFPFQPAQLSDGTLRFICLATALLQPSPPVCLLIDEPELGLHPSAITLVANLVRSAAARTQVLVSTQSPMFLDHFEARDVVTVERRTGRSVFQRLDDAQLAEWLGEYSVGELWQKNVVRAGPTNE